MESLTCKMSGSGAEILQNSSFVRCGRPAAIADRRDVSQTPMKFSSTRMFALESARVAMSAAEFCSSRRGVFHQMDR
jgi:hypothetical protein